MTQRLRSRVLYAAIAALTFVAIAPRARGDRRDEIAARLQSIDKKIADAESMQAAINKSPDDYADVAQTLNVLADTLAKLRAQKAELTRELLGRRRPSP